MRIEYLADNQKFIKQIAEWCNREWPWYYNSGDINAALSYHQKTAQRSSIPVALVALEGNELVGTISIIKEDMEIRPNLSPWLGCLFVDPAHRGRGIASKLLKEGISLANRLGVKEIFAWTESLTKSLQINGWELMESVVYQARNVDILSRRLKEKV